MNKIAKQLAYKTFRQYKLRNSRNYNDITAVIEKQGFILIPFKKYNNTKEVAECIEKLHLEDKIQKKNAFIYLSNNIKLVFVNSDLSDEDKYILLSHELGHILDPSLQNSNFSYFKIQNEEFANEFSYHLQNPSIWIRLKFSRFFKPLSATIFIICLLIVGGIVVTNIANNLSVSSPISSAQKCYVTPNGKKYHRDFCIVIKNRKNIKTYKTSEDAKDEGYDPCLLCIGDE